MLDPFPLPLPKTLSNAIQPLASHLNLQTLPLHIHEVLIAFTFYHVTNTILAPRLSKALFPTSYRSFNARTRLNWNVHIVSLVQSCLINTMALWVMWKDEERKSMSWEEKVWGYTGAGGLIQAFAGGYFLWDLVVTVQNVGVFGVGMLAHAVSALFVFSLGFRPFLNFYGPTFILYELSSPFLNIHWFCDKLNLTGSRLQLYNGILLLLTFFSCRLLWGSYQSIRVFQDVYSALNHSAYNTTSFDPSTAKPGSTTQGSVDEKAEMMRFMGEQHIPVWLPLTYLASNVCLNGLNWYWFGQMIAAIRKRFDPPFGTKRAGKGQKPEPVLVEGTDVETDEEGHGDVVKASGVEVVEDGETVLGRGIDDEGRRSVEIEKTEIRSRKRG